MRLFEIILIVLLLIRSLTTLSSYARGKKWRIAATFATCAGLVGHLLLEGWRWQMIPFYLAVFIALTVDLTRLPSKLEDLPKGNSLRRSLVGLVSLGIFAVLPILMPVPNLPKPTGEALVGSFSYELTDKARAELYAETSQDRRVVVRVWYPAASKTKRAPWIESAEQMLPVMARSGGLPSFMLNHLRYTKSHAFWQAPVEETSEAYPVVFFEHGLWGHRAQNTFLVEDLASQGYVVFAVEHPYGALQTVFEDGTVALYHEGVLPDESDADYDAATKRLAGQWAQDISFVLNNLSITANQDLRSLVQNADLSRVGVVGHSTGGASTLTFCEQDDRCAAAVLLDPWLQPTSLAASENGTSQALLTLFSDLELNYFKESNQERYAAFLENQTAPTQSFFIANTGHHDFDDTGLLSPIARYFGHSKGSLPANKSFKIVRSYTEAQFDKYLRNNENSLLENEQSPYSEIELAYPTIETLEPALESPETNTASPSETEDVLEEDSQTEPTPEEPATQSEDAQAEDLNEAQETLEPSPESSNESLEESQESATDIAVPEETEEETLEPDTTENESSESLELVKPEEPSSDETMDAQDNETPDASEETPAEDETQE